MYQKGEYISYGNNGVCMVEGITLKDVPGSREKHEYYVLRPIYRKDDTIFCPVDTNKGAHRRRILTQKESYELLDQVQTLDNIQSKNPKDFDDKCKQAVSSGQCSEWLKVIKTLSAEESARKQHGKKLTATHERILKTAANNLCGELAFTLQKDISQIESLLKDLLAT